jgi:hypothetical protein
MGDRPGPDIDHAAQRVAAVKRRKRPTDDFDALHFVDRQAGPGDTAVEGIVDRLAVEQHQGAIRAGKSAQHRGGHGISRPFVAFGVKTRHHIKAFVERLHVAVPKVLDGYDTGGGLLLVSLLFRSRRRHKDGAAHAAHCQ